MSGKDSSTISKGNDHVIDAVRRAMLARKQSVLKQVGEETVSSVPLKTDPVFIQTGNDGLMRAGFVTTIPYDSLR